MTPDPVPRLRMFAGPNGSGKTTVKTALNKPAAWFGVYINPDDIEAAVRRDGVLPLAPLGLTATHRPNAFGSSRANTRQKVSWLGLPLG